MLYRYAHSAADSTNEILAPLRGAILASSSESMRAQAEQARRAAALILHRLQLALEEGAHDGELNLAEGRVDYRFVQAAANALRRALARGERMAATTSVPALRAVMLDVMTDADHAAACLRVAIGEELS